MQTCRLPLPSLTRSLVGVCGRLDRRSVGSGCKKGRGETGSILRRRPRFGGSESWPTAGFSQMMAASREAGSVANIGVLFVCLGNICRSPTAEAMFRTVVENAGVGHLFDIDSCGTGGGNPNWYLEGGWSYHEGDQSDPRMKEAAKRRGVRIASVSRALSPDDLGRFNYIIGMDMSNITNMKTAVNFWRARYSMPGDALNRMSLMTSYCRENKGAKEVPDPYYGGDEGFDVVLDLLEDACSGLLEAIKKEHPEIF